MEMKVLLVYMRCMGMIVAVFHVMGIMFELMMLLKSLFVTEMECYDRYFICIGVRLSGASDFNGLEFLIAVSTLLIIL